jgi:hypothetical protein
VPNRVKTKTTQWVEAATLGEEQDNNMLLAILMEKPMGSIIFHVFNRDVMGFEVPGGMKTPCMDNLKFDQHI